MSRHWKGATAKELKKLLERPLGELDLVVVRPAGSSSTGTRCSQPLESRDMGRSTCSACGRAGRRTRGSRGPHRQLGGAGSRDPSEARLRSGRGQGALEGPEGHAREAAEIQRCQIHKERNVLSCLSGADQAAVRRRLRNVWGLKRHEDAKAALKAALACLRGLSESAASNLEEGLEETLTLDRISVPESPRVHLRSTNSIENVFSRVRSHARNVKNWRSEEMVERRAAAGLLQAKRGFRRIQAYRDLESLVVALGGELADDGAAA